MKPGVLLLSSETLVNFENKVVFNVYELLQSAMPGDYVVIALPNISINDLAPLKKDLTECANADSIDLTAIVFYAKNHTTWSLGFDDGSQQIRVNIYTREYFESFPEAEINFFKDIVEKAQL